MSSRYALLLLSALACGTAAAAEDDPCTRFTWNVTHELSVMRQTPQPLAAALKAGKDAPQLQVDKVYEVALAGQSGVTFALTPGKPTLPDNSQAGVLRFQSDKAGRYRISITSGHWIDVVSNGKLVTSRDFQGARGCERPRKIVEYELPANGDFTLQLSGAADQKVILAVTAVAPGASS